MGIITHNLLSQFSNRQLNITTRNKAKNAERLSSGYKINRSADDAAGLSISEKMRWQIRGLNRASNNTEEGISLCQVADGALAEVQDMLHRINELSVQAANDTNTKADREAIQKEISQLTEEIDHIAEETTFNTQPVFKGEDIKVLDANGNAINKGDVTVKQLELANIGLGHAPFSGGSSGNQLGLQAVMKDNAAVNWNLIYGRGSTSNSSFVLKYSDGLGGSTSKQINLSSLTASNYQVTGNDTWSRDFSYTNADGVDVTLTQIIKVVETSDDEKNYEISYTVTNNNSKDLTIDFMFHADTAYNNNDRCEGYFANGTRIDKFCVYSDANSPYTNGSTSSNVINGTLDSFSIVDVDNALSFAEKIEIDTANRPDSISIGHYSQIDDWSYYDQIRNNSNTQLGQSSQRTDLGFSLLWNKALNGNTSQTFNFKYGIISTKVDNNLTNVTLKKSNEFVVEHTDNKPFWIQSGARENEGMFINIDGMSSQGLGLDTINVTSHEGAKSAITAAQAALEKVSANRSKIGAQQNRLEYTKNFVDNTSENTQAAESRIRDADMAEEMVSYSKHSILEQAGQSMLAQANQSPQGILQLLQ